MIVRRPNRKVLLSIKTFYPRGAYRLPTGGIHHGEGIFEALVRETLEETGLETTIRRFLAAIASRPRSSPDGPPIFHTFAFLLDEVGGVLEARDREERIEEYREVDLAELSTVADRLERVTSVHSVDVGGDWADWGRFRAGGHRGGPAPLAQES